MAYSGVLTADFVDYDDRDYVYQNPNVLNGISAAGWKYAWTTFDCGNWHPLTWLSLQWDASLWNRRVIGFHFTNLILHTANGLLVFAVLYQLTSAIIRSAIVALFFALHPLHVESVAWIAERKDVLSTFFLLLTVLAYRRYAQRESLLTYLATMILFACGLLAKPMLVTLPVLLLLLDFWPMNRTGWITTESTEPTYPQRSVGWLLLEKVPLFGVALVDGIMTMAAQKVQYVTLRDVELPTRIANAFNAYAWYLQKTFVPTDLIVLYPHPERDLSWSRIAIGVILVAGISLWALRRVRQSGYLLFGWAWFVVSLLPVIGLIQVGGQAYADRYTYIPHIGLFTAVVWEGQSLVDRWKWSRIPMIVITLIAVVACGVLTETQVFYWRDSATLWTHAHNVDRDNYVAHEHLAELYYRQRNFEQAAKHFERTLRNKRMHANANAYAAYGYCLEELKQPAEAETQYRKALKIDHKHANALQLLVALLQRRGRSNEAIAFTGQLPLNLSDADVQNAERNPDNEAAQLTLGLAKAGRGDVAGAVVHFEKAVELAPKSANAYSNLAYAQAQLQRMDEAKTNYSRAIELNPDVADSHFNLAHLLEMEKDYAGAKKHYTEAVRLNPADAEAKARLERVSKR